MLNFQLYSSLKRHLTKCHPNLTSSEDSVNEDERADGLVDPDNDDMAAMEEGVPMEEDENAPFEAAGIEDRDVFKRTIPSLTRLAARITVDLRSNSSVTGAVLSRVFSSLSECVDVIISDLKIEVQGVLEAGRVDPDVISGALDKFNVINPFDELETIDQSVNL